MRKKINILVVDDDKLFLKIFCRYLEKKFSNCIIRKTESPIDAIEIVTKQSKKSDPIHLAILDWKMPEISGEFLSVFLKEIDPKITNIMLTSCSSEEYKHFSTFKFDKILSKGIGMESLLFDIQLFIKMIENNMSKIV